MKQAAEKSHRTLHRFVRRYEVGGHGGGSNYLPLILARSCFSTYFKHYHICVFQAGLNESVVRILSDTKLVTSASDRNFPSVQVVHTEGMKVFISPEKLKVR